MSLLQSYVICPCNFYEYFMPTGFGFVEQIFNHETELEFKEPESSFCEIKTPLGVTYL